MKIFCCKEDWGVAYLYAWILALLIGFVICTVDRHSSRSAVREVRAVVLTQEKPNYALTERLSTEPSVGLRYHFK